MRIVLRNIEFENAIKPILFLAVVIPILFSCQTMQSEGFWSECNTENLHAISLALPGIIMEYNHSSHTTLYINPEDKNEARKSAVSILSRLWSISNREDLFQQISWLREKGTTAQLRDILMLSEKYPRDEIVQLHRKGEINEDQLQRVQFVRNFSEAFNEDEFLGFDLSRIIALSRWGYDAGYISKEEAWHQIESVANEIIDLFSSWQHFGSNYVLGRAFLNAASGQGEYYLRESSLLYFRLMERGVWNNIPWPKEKKLPDKHLYFINKYYPHHLFYNAIESNNAEAVTSQLSKHEYLDEPYIWGHSPIFLSILYASPEILMILLENRCNPNTPLSNGMTPLCCAVIQNKKEHLALLLTAHACVNSRIFDGMTPELYAAKFGDKQIMEMLYEAGAELYSVDDKGYSTLLYVLLRNNFSEKKELATYLIERGAGLNSVANNGISPLFLLIIEGYTDLANLVLDLTENPDPSRFNNHTVLMYAVAKNEIGLVKKLISLGADVNAQTENGQTALHYACFEPEMPSVVRELILAGADLNVLASGFAPLHLAVEHRCPDTFRLLIQAGADVNICVPIKNLTPLHYAVLSEQYDMVRYLLLKGSDPTIRNADNFSPFDFLIMKNSYPDDFLVSLLPLFLEKGVDIFLPNGFNRTPHEFIRNRLSPDEIQKYLNIIRRYGITVPSEDRIVSEETIGNIKKVLSLPRNHPQVDAIGGMGEIVSFGGRSLRIEGGMTACVSGSIVKFNAIFSGFNEEHLKISWFSDRNWNQPLQDHSGFPIKYETKIKSYKIVSVIVEDDKYRLLAETFMWITPAEE